MTTLTKAMTPFSMKGLNTTERTFEGLASTWDLDTGGDQIMPGAYKRTLDHWRQSGRSLPLIDQHDYSSVTRTRLGKLLDAAETEAGLWTKWKVFETAAGNDFLAILNEQGIDGLSIGYSAVGEPEYKSGTRILREVKLYEVSAVHWGMNEGALIDQHSVKSILAAALKDRRLSDEDRTTLRELLDTPPVVTPPAAAPTTPEAKTLAPEEQDALRTRILRLKLARIVTRAA